MNHTRLPVVTLAICAITSAVYLLPPLQALLVYDREAVSDGELWRLLTGNLVHFSGAHLAKDMAALLVAGIVIELRGHRQLALLGFLSSLLIGIGLYVLEPDVLIYGGLSGVAVAAFAHLGLEGAATSGFRGWLCRLVVAGLAAKIALDFGLAPQESAGFVLVPLSHAIGALTASALFATTHLPRIVSLHLPGRRHATASVLVGIRGNGACMAAPRPRAALDSPRRVSE